MAQKDTIAKLGEMGIIREFARDFPRQTDGLLCGVGDDAAVLKGGLQAWLVTTDLMQEGVHFDPRWAPWDHVGYKALQVNLSDIAAMGGHPVFFWLNLSLPQNFSLQDLKALRIGVNRAARKARVICAGGDTNRSSGGVIVSVTLLGRAQTKVAYRHGAKIGDDLYVTGRLGEAALGLVLLKRNRVHESGARPFCRRQTVPQARLEAGQKLTKAGLVHAMIDLSDGLAKDLGHLITESGVGAEIQLSPLTPPARFKRLCQKLKLKPFDLILGAGEDYELLFAAPPNREEMIRSWSKTLHLPITKIGKIVRGRHIIYKDSFGKTVSMKTKGYEHFRESTR